MRCPYLKDALVKYCRVSAFKKMILQAPGQAKQERCSTSAYRECSLVQERGRDVLFQSCCPYLQESSARYCSAAPLTKFIPSSDAEISPCLSESHRYCEFYLGAGPAAGLAQRLPIETRAAQAEVTAFCPETIGGIEIPSRLYYSSNHMWLDVNEGGVCHVGLDAFWTRVFGTVEQLSFQTTKGPDFPTAVITVYGIDLHMVFPNRLFVVRTNAALRSKPEKLSSAPYTLGWMFEGKDLEPGQACAGLIHGAPARPWVERELHRLSSFLEGRLFTLPPVERKGALKGRGRAGRSRDLRREDVVELFNEFFVPPADRSTKTRGSFEGAG